MRQQKGIKMSTINSVNAASYTPPAPTASTVAPSSSVPARPQGQDAVELSLAGRIALGVNDGKLTSAQGQTLDSQLQTVNQTIQSGGSGISQLQSQLSQQIYGDTHNGATIPTGLTVTSSEERDFFQAGRVAADENAGNLTSTQGSQFLSQISQIYQQSQNGASPTATFQAQNQLSAEIFDTAHNFTPNANPS
jgi:hypothetical protein